MGSEKSLWNTLKNKMKGYWEADRIENLVGAGVPDVAYTMKANGNSGWIELKHVHRWPKRINTILKVDHFTSSQKLFLIRHGRAGGNVFVLMQVERDYLLFDWQMALNIGKLSKMEYFETGNHLQYWRNSIKIKELIQFLL